MSFISKLFSKGATDLIDSTGKVIDNLSTSDQEKSQAKQQLTEVVLNSLNTLQEAQKEIILAEAGGNWLQRSWRPLVMLAFASIVIIGAFTTISYLSDTSPFWELLKLGMGGYVIGRTAEKISDNITKNADITFLKKKDRKDAIND